MTEIRNENEDLRSAAVIADEAYQELLAAKGILEMDLHRAKDDNSHLLQQVCSSLCFFSAYPAFFCLGYKYRCYVLIAWHWDSSFTHLQQECKSRSCDGFATVWLAFVGITV